MASINHITILGRCGKDPEVRHLESGSTVTNFTVATSETWKDKSGEKKESTQWHQVTCWGATAEIAEKYVHKGDQICVIGKLQYDQYEKEGVKHTVAKIKVDQLVLLGGNKKAEPKEDFNSPPAPIDEQGSGDDDQLPF